MMSMLTWRSGGMCCDECRPVIINVTMLMTVFLVGTKDGEL